MAVARRLTTLALALTVGACGADPAAADDAPAPSLRSGRFGSLRDFVLLDRADPGRGGALFVDRFEATQADWSEFAETPEGRAVAADQVALVGRRSLPVGGMDLRQARAFATWRCGRLPSEAEWQRAAEGGGRSPFPWGSKEDATRANTGDLALGERMPVGTFESGRKAGGDAPYDLIGNVREWTESVPLEWCQEGGPGDGFARYARGVQRLPSMAVWADRFGHVPAGMAVAVGGGAVPRRCVGADFETPMRFVRERRYDTQCAEERRVRTGLRVYTTAGELLGRLAALPGSVDPKAEEQLRAFVRRGEHRAALRAAYERSPLAREELPRGSAGRVLLDEVLRSP